ncbi:MAG: hypothetical protein SNJ59_03660 [Aggregatilineales bacterium]
MDDERNRHREIEDASSDVTPVEPPDSEDEPATKMPASQELELLDVSLPASSGETLEITQQEVSVQDLEAEEAASGIESAVKEAAAAEDAEQQDDWMQADPEADAAYLQTLVGSEAGDLNALLDAITSDDADARRRAFDSVASVSDAAALREDEERRRAYKPPAYKPNLAVPPPIALKRGHPGSLVPGLILIGLGAWLTVMTTTNTPIEPLLLAAMVVGALAVTLLAQWLGNGRWGRGLLFAALALILAGALFALSLQPGGIDLTRGWPLLIAVIGAATVLSAVLARPAERRLIAPGVLLLIAGLLGTIITNAVFDPELLAAAAPLWPVIILIMIVLWLLPLIFRQRD